jgi:hypothetical protein
MEEVGGGGECKQRLSWFWAQMNRDVMIEEMTPNRDLLSSDHLDSQTSQRQATNDIHK